MTQISEVHRRYNPLKREYILVSPHRMQRPWQGQLEDKDVLIEIEYDDKCFLCPRNTRSSGLVNDDYKSTFVFKNDFSALLPQDKKEKESESELFKSQPCSGQCHVICFSPHHSKTMGNMSITEIEDRKSVV